LDQLLTTYPRFLVKKFVSSDTILKTVPSLELKRRLYSKFDISGHLDLSIAKRFGEFSKRHIRSNTDVFIGWSSASLEAIKPAQSLGAKVIIERGSTHIAEQTDVLCAAYKEFGLRFNVTDLEIIEREEQEYLLADRISVPSNYAAQTFVDRGFSKDKIFINGYGVNLELFQPPFARPLARKPRIIFAGSVGIRKGVPWLLDAFKHLSSKADLHLIGPVSRDYEALLRANIGKNIYVRGSLPGSQLVAEYGRGDIFCLPSLEEGYGLVILQAMACGLPIVTTHIVGAADLLEHGHNGLIVAPGDRAALADALMRLVDDAPLRQSMGANALTTVRSKHSWDDYVERAIAFYDNL
jgi:glycosyltransferase involved in cell wall biosynthesis